MPKLRDFLRAGRQTSHQVFVKCRLYGDERIIHPKPSFFRCNQSCFTQISQMAGSGRLGNLNNVHQVADTHFAFEEKIQQAQPCPIRNSSEFQFRVRQGVGHSFPLSLLFVPEESSVEGEKPIRHDSTARKFGPSFLYFHFF